MGGGGRAGSVRSRAGARSTALLLVGDGHGGGPRGGHATLAGDLPDREDQLPLRAGTEGDLVGSVVFGDRPVLDAPHVLAPRMVRDGGGEGVLVGLRRAGGP